VSKSKSKKATEAADVRGCVDLLDTVRGWHAVENNEGASLAELWAFSPASLHGLTGTHAEKVGTSMDVYDLLDDFRAGEYARPEGCYAVALVTWGWAAPINPATGEIDGAPSSHPSRRRVRLVSCVDHDGRAFSRLHFPDTGETVDDEGEARGPLAEAMADAFTR